MCLIRVCAPNMVNSPYPESPVPKLLDPEGFSVWEGVATASIPWALGMAPGSRVERGSFLQWPPCQDPRGREPCLAVPVSSPRLDQRSLWPGPGQKPASPGASIPHEILCKTP